MSRALAYLLGMRLKNTLLGVLRRPSRWIGVLLLFASFGWIMVARSMGDSGEAASTLPAGLVLTAVLGLYLLLAVLGGIGEPGLGFLPADLDYVLPGPFRKRQVLTYHLARQYGQILLLSLIYVFFLGGAAIQRYDIAFLGTALCLMVAAHLQAASTLLASTLEEGVFGRLRRASRIGVLAILVVAAVVAIVGVAGAGSVPGVLHRVMSTPVAKVVLYPAVAAGHVAASTSLGAALPHLAGLLVLAILSFGLVLLFPLDVGESTYVKAADRRRRLDGEDGRSVSSGRGRSGLRGAAAVAWLNTLILRRRLRIVVGFIAMLLVLLLVSGASSGGETEGSARILGVLAFFPVITNLPLGFRGQRDHLELLKTLPLAPLRIAVAQVAVPVLLIYAAQALVVALFTVWGRLEVPWAVAAFVALPIFDLGVVALVETFQLDRDPRQAGFLWVTLQMLLIMVTVVPAFAASVLVVKLGGTLGLAVGAGTLIHMGVAYGLLRLLAWRFGAWEPGKDAV